MKHMEPFVNNASSSNANFFDVLELVETLNEQHRRKFPEVLVMTAEIEAALKKSVSVEQLSGPPMTFAGIPYEVYATKTEAVARCLELVQQGKRPQLCVMES